MTNDGMAYGHVRRIHEFPENIFINYFIDDVVYITHEIDNWLAPKYDSPIALHHIARNKQTKSSKK